MGVTELQWKEAFVNLTIHLRHPSAVFRFQRADVHDMNPSLLGLYAGIIFYLTTTLLYSTLLYSILLYSTLLYSTLLYIYIYCSLL